MYIVDLLKRLMHRTNIPSLIYILLNIALITVVINFVLSASCYYVPTWQCLLLAIAIYSICIAVAISPFGEWLLRVINGCKKLKNVPVAAEAEYIFMEIYKEAKTANPSLPDDINFMIKLSDGNNSDGYANKEVNAFAIGRKTVCVTDGLLLLPENQIKAVLAHEFGHLANKDTDMILLISVGNLIVMCIVIVFRIIIFVFQVVCSMIFGAVFTLFFNSTNGTVAISYIANMLVSIFVTGIISLWTYIGVLLVMKSNRLREYEADTFAVDLGYGEAMCEFLLGAVGYSTGKGFFACLRDSHPKPEKRIEAIRAIMNANNALN